MPMSFARHQFDIREPPMSGEHKGQLAPDHVPVTAPLVNKDAVVVIEVGNRAALGFAGRMLSELPCVHEVLYVDCRPSWAEHSGLCAHLRHGKREVCAHSSSLIMTQSEYDAA